MKKILLIIIVFAIGMFIVSLVFKRQDAPRASAPASFDESGTHLEGVLYPVPGFSTTIELRNNPIHFSEGEREATVDLIEELEKSFSSGNTTYVVAPILVRMNEVDSVYISLFESSPSPLFVESILFGSQAPEVIEISSINDRSLITLIFGGFTRSYVLEGGRLLETRGE